MGYTTEFIGKFTFNREPSQELKDYINCFAKTRHVKRDVEAIQKIFLIGKRERGKESWEEKRNSFCNRIMKLIIRVMTGWI